jgi:hypothetical protein
MEGPDERICLCCRKPWQPGPPRGPACTCYLAVACPGCLRCPAHCPCRIALADALTIVVNPEVAEELGRARRRRRGRSL